MTQAVKLVVRWSGGVTGEMRNIFYYTTDGDYTDTTITNWLTEVFTPLIPHIHTPWNIYGVDVSTFMLGHSDTDPKGWSASEFVTVTLDMNGAGDGLPPADSAVVIGRTGVKHVMARKFIGGLLESEQNQGRLEAGAVTALQSFAAKWLNPTAKPAGTTSTPAAWGPVHGFTTIQSMKVDTNIFHLRRRQEGRGI